MCVLLLIKQLTSIKKSIFIKTILKINTKTIVL